MTRPVDFGEFRKGIDPIERRERRAVTMHAFVATEEGVTGEALVLDLSYDGCGIESPLPLAVGQIVTLSVPDRGVISARVRWWSEGRGGLIFESSESPDGEQQERAAERNPVALEGSLRRLGMGNYRVNVFDLSPQGCKVELVERPRVGEHVLLKFDRMDVMDAEVCWVQEHFAGLRFERSIHDAVFALLMKRLADKS